MARTKKQPIQPPTPADVAALFDQLDTEGKKHVADYAARIVAEEIKELKQRLENLQKTEKS